MKKKNYKSGLELLEEVQDPLKNRLRVCPNPECRKQHWVHNRGRDFCSKKCYDNWYNRNRKYINEYEKDAENGNVIMLQDSEKQGIVCTTTIPDGQKKYDVSLLMLDGLTIDPVIGTLFKLDDLIKAGLDPSACLARVKLYNIEEKYNAHFLQFGSYELYYMDYNSILIYKNKNHGL